MARRQKQPDHLRFTVIKTGCMDASFNTEAEALDYVKDTQSNCATYEIFDTKEFRRLHVLRKEH